MELKKNNIINTPPCSSQFIVRIVVVSICGRSWSWWWWWRRYCSSNMNPAVKILHKSENPILSLDIRKPPTNIYILIPYVDDATTSSSSSSSTISVWYKNKSASRPTVIISPTKMAEEGLYEQVRFFFFFIIFLFFFFLPDIDEERRIVSEIIDLYKTSSGSCSCCDGWSFFFTFTNTTYIFQICWTHII